MVFYEYEIRGPILATLTSMVQYNLALTVKKYRIIIKFYFFPLKIFKY